MALLDSYLDIITGQHRDKPKYISTISKLLSYSDEVFKVGVYLNGDFDLDEAVGQQQDIVGQIIDIDRPYGMNDTQYRVLQRLKIIKNLWDGTINDLYEKWLNLFGVPIYVVDHQDMSLDLYVKTEVNHDPSAEMSALRQLIQAGYVMPKPMGVGYNFTLQYLLGYHENIELPTSEPIFSIKLGGYEDVVPYGNFKPLVRNLNLLRGDKKRTGVENLHIGQLDLLMRLTFVDSLTFPTIRDGVRRTGELRRGFTTFPIDYGFHSSIKLIQEDQTHDVSESANFKIKTRYEDVVPYGNFAPLVRNSNLKRAGVLIRSPKTIRGAGMIRGQPVPFSASRRTGVENLHIDQLSLNLRLDLSDSMEIPTIRNAERRNRSLRRGKTIFPVDFDLNSCVRLTQEDTVDQPTESMNALSVKYTPLRGNLRRSPFLLRGTQSLLLDENTSVLRDFNGNIKVVKECT